MRYFAFEAGSRAGFSTEKFFHAYKRQVASEDTLVLVDADPVFTLLPTEACLSRITEDVAMRIITKDDLVFPCDELTRQGNRIVKGIVSNHVSCVEDWFYNKRAVNKRLSEKACAIKIPTTFQCEDLFIKPNTKSAGSKGCYSASNLCISEHINIRHEYVVDCLEKDGELKVFPREVILRNGYDKYVKLLPISGKLALQVHEFVKSVNSPLFSGIFHLQIAENECGELYYIESSKRISGSSVVNLHRGFNPFCFINGIDAKDENLHLEDKWYRFEDLI